MNTILVYDLIVKKYGIIFHYLLKKNLNVLVVQNTDEGVCFCDYLYCLIIQIQTIFIIRNDFIN